MINNNLGIPTTQQVYNGVIISMKADIYYMPLSMCTTVQLFFIVWIPFFGMFSI